MRCRRDALDERSERLDRDTARRREPLDLTHQRDDVVRGDRPRPRGSACAPSPATSERPQAELLGERHDFGIARDRRPGSREPVESRGGRGERLQRMHRAARARRVATPATGSKTSSPRDPATCTTSAPRSSDGAAATAAASIDAVRCRDEDDFRTLVRLRKRASRSWPSTRPPRSSMRSPGRGPRPRRHAIRDRRARGRASCPRGRDQSAQQCDCRRPPSCPLTTASSRTPPVRSPAEDPMLPMQIRTSGRGSESSPCPATRSGATARSGARTNSRSHMRGCGIVSVGIVHLDLVVEQDVDVERARTEPLFAHSSGVLLTSRARARAAPTGRDRCRSRRPR